MKISFLGAAQTVTGSRTHIEHRGFQAFVDCGLYQGPKTLRNLNWQEHPELKKINAILLTHAHIDHSGLLPRMVAEGWKGPIYCTPSTKELLQVMLMDSAKLQEEDAYFANRTKHSHHDPALPLYTSVDALATFPLLQVTPFDQWVKLSPHLSFRFLRAGHILGSAIVQLSFIDEEKSKIITFTGDLGNANSDLMKDPVHVTETDYLVLETTYGDRPINFSNRESELASVVNKVIGRGGTLVIPAFAVGRTQDLLFTLFKLLSEKKIPPVPIYVDSPMAKKVTEIYLKNLQDLSISPENNHIESALSQNFFRTVESPDDSMLLCMSDDPKIVISASGMLQGGRVLHHLKCKLPHEKNGVLFVGFQGAETKGRLLLEGIRNIRLHHKEISVEAEIFKIEGYSAHADREQLLSWVKSLVKLPEKVFLNHGEYQGQLAFAKILELQLGHSVVIPKLGDSFEL